MPEIVLQRPSVAFFTYLAIAGACGSDGPAADTGAWSPTSSGHGSADDADTETDPSHAGTSSPNTTTGGPQATDATPDDGDTTSALDLPPESDCPRVRVVVPAGEVLNVRPDPSTANAAIGTLPNNAIVDVIAEVEGEAVEGDTLWFQIAYLETEGFVSAVFAECTLDEAPDLQPPAGFYLPLECGVQANVTQGNNGVLSHNGLHAYAFDFGVGLNSPLVAMADGIVSLIYADTVPGDACYDGGGPECGPYGNLVILLHGDGSTSLYKHLNEVHVAVGEFVPRGVPVGLSGSTGYSTGRHAHIMRMENCGALTCQSIPLEFVEAGVPVTGDSVTSENCI